MIYLKTELGILYYGDVLNEINQIEDDSVALTVTSPPYYNLRDYSTWETYQDYLDFCQELFNQLYRITMPSGFVCWNVQDSIPFPPSVTGEERYHEPVSAHHTVGLINAGFCYENTIIWYKGKGTATQKMFGCLALDSRIKLSNGAFKYIRDINVNDEIFAWGSNKIEKEKVTHIFDKSALTYEIKCRNRTIRATNNHKFLVMSRNPTGKLKYSGRFWDIKWKSTNELIYGCKITENNDHLLLPLYNECATAELPYPAELLGFFIGDGWCNHSNGRLVNRVDFEIHNHEIKSKYLSIIRNKMNLNPWITSNDDLGTLHVASIRFARWLVNNDFDHYSYEKRVPEIIFNASFDDKIKFLSGYIDADGSIDKKTGLITLTSASKRLIYDVKELFELIGVIPGNVLYDEKRRISFINSRQVISRPRYILKISLRQYQRLEFTTLKLKNIRQNVNKNNRVVSYNNQIFVPQKIFSVGNGLYLPVRDITVENYHNFIVNGIVSHNSYPYPPTTIMSNLTENIIVVRKQKGNYKRDKTFKEESKYDKNFWGQFATDFWEIPPESAKRIGHSAPFPPGIPERCIKFFTFVNDIVFDPFMGSGTTALMAETLKRRWVGCEWIKSHCELIQSRIHNEVMLGKFFK